MKLARILLAQAVRFAKVAGARGGAVYGLNLAKACEERYGFLQAPRILADYDLGKGVTFLHGYFQQRFVIDRFQIFENGVLAEARVDTDECEEFLDDVFKWVAERAGITIDPSTTPPQKMYLSQIEVQSNISLNSSFAKVASLGKQISDLQRGYGQIIPDLEVSGLSLGATGDAISFKFERREGPSVPPDLYFASSRLRTKDHIKMLEALEELL